MLERFTERARRVVFFARYEARRFGAHSIKPEHILLGLLREGRDVLMNYLHDKETLEFLRNEIETHSAAMVKALAPPPDPPLSLGAERVLNYADDESRRLSHPAVTVQHLLLGILRESESFSARLLYMQGLRLERVRSESRRQAGSGWRADQEQKTPWLAKVSRDLTEDVILDRVDPLVGRESEIERIAHILCRRTKNNPLLIGEPGVGKTAIVEGLAQRIVRGEVPWFLRTKRILALDLSLVIAGSKYRGQFEERLKEIVQELIENPDLIVFIDEVHTLVGAGAAEGSLDAANILKPALARGELQCIGATTPAEFRKAFEANPSLERRFQAVKVSQPTEEETIRILRGIKSRYEAFHHVRYTEDAIETAVTQSQRYIPDRALPDKAIDVIDEAGSQVKIRNASLLPEGMDTGRRRPGDGYQSRPTDGEPFEPEQFFVVTREDVEEVISLWTGIPTTSIKEAEAEKLLYIEEKLHDRVIGQHKAISALARAIRRTRAGLKNSERPIGSFLFLGPTGVGKTEVARTLAEYLFGSERALARFDMSEYMEKHSVSKLIGSPPGYVGFEDGGQLTRRIKQSPFSVLLLDEIEKAHPDILNILLQVLEDGALTDSQGNKVDFKNVIIIITSNIGARFLQKRGVLGFQTAEAENENVEEGVMLAVKQTFSPELINRLDEIIVFDPLTDEDLFKIIGLILNSFNSRIARRNLRVQMTEEAKRWIIEKTCADRSYGARPLRRALQKYVEDPLSHAIISGGVTNASIVEVVVEGDALQYFPLEADGLNDAVSSQDLIAIG